MSPAFRAAAVASRARSGWRTPWSCSSASPSTARRRCSRSIWPSGWGWARGRRLARRALLGRPVLPAGPGRHVVDRYGFKRSLAACFSIFCVGYFLIGLAGLNFGQAIVAAVGQGAVHRRRADADRRRRLADQAVHRRHGGPDVGARGRSLGFSIYYTLVNIGGALGPILALQVRENLGIEYVLVMSSITSLFCLLGTLLFFREPEREPGRGGAHVVRQGAARHGDGVPQRPLHRLPG